MSKDRLKIAIAWVMLVAGLIGAACTFGRLIAPTEPQWVLQLSWAAIWVTGIVGVIAADDPGLSDDDVERIARRVADFVAER